MNICKQIPLVSALLGLTFMSTGLAQDAAVVEEPQLYQVELLVFRYLDQSQTTAEIPRMPKAEIADILDQDLARTDNSYAVINEAEPVLVDEQYWQPLEANQYQLNNVANRLNRVNAYELLLHLAWQQTAPDISEALKVNLAELGVDPALISGTVNLFQRRYLHLALDLKLNNGSRASAGSGFGDSFQLFGAPVAIPAIADSRRIRLEELHYFDQPEFGIIVMVARAETAP